MKKAFAFIPVGALVLILAAVWWWTPQQGKSLVTNAGASAPTGVESPSADSRHQPVVLNRNSRSDEADQGARERLELALDRWRERLRDHQANPGNLQQFMHQVRNRCDGDHKACMEMLDLILADYHDRDFARQVRRIFRQWPDYTRQQDAMTLSRDDSLATRYEAMKRLRREAFGEEASELLFGQEAALARYRTAMEEFVDERAPNLPMEERLQAAEALRQDSLGEYEAALGEREDARDRYERQKEVLLSGVEDDEERRRITAELRERHFGPEKAEAIAARDEQLRRQKTEVANYKERLAALKAKRDQWRKTDPDWEARYQQRLEQLRREAFDGP